MVSGLPLHRLLGKDAWVTWPEVGWEAVKGRRGRAVGDDSGGSAAPQAAG